MNSDIESIFDLNNKRLVSYQNEMKKKLKLELNDVQFSLVTKPIIICKTNTTMHFPIATLVIYDVCMAGLTFNNQRSPLNITVIYVG